MLLLVTILLVVVGTISLVIGFVQSSLLPIYISIGCSILAALVLLIFSRMTAKSQQVVTADEGPAPLDTGRDRTEADRTAPVPAFAGTGLIGGSSSLGDTFAPDHSGSEAAAYGAVEDADDVEDDDFPIERYDSRRVGEILPLLAELDLDELDLVREHEEQGKSRATVLARIDQLIDQLEAEDRQEAASRFDDGGSDDADVLDDHLEEDDGEDEDDEQEAPTLRPASPPPPTMAVTVAALPEDDGYFPIEDYDDLRASEILPLLPELDDDELEMVQERERSGSARSSVLRRIEALLGPAAPEPEPEPEPEVVVAVVPVAVPRATRKSPAKRAPAKTASAKTVDGASPERPRKAAGARPAAPVAPAKKAPVARKAAASKAAAPGPVEKAGASSSRAKKAASIAPVKAGRSPAKKAPVVTKVPAAKKSQAEKVAAAKRTASKIGAAPATTKAAKSTRKAAKG